MAISGLKRLDVFINDIVKLKRPLNQEFKLFMHLMFTLSRSGLS